MKLFRTLYSMDISTAQSGHQKVKGSVDDGDRAIGGREGA